MTPNPPIPGHTLKFEGHTRYHYNLHAHEGGCECGAQPPEFPNLSVNQMKKWHRTHKEEVRARAS